MNENKEIFIKKSSTRIQSCPQTWKFSIFIFILAASFLLGLIFGCFLSLKFSKKSKEEKVENSHSTVNEFRKQEGHLNLFNNFSDRINPQSFKNLNVESFIEQVKEMDYWLLKTREKKERKTLFSLRSSTNNSIDVDKNFTIWQSHFPTSFEREVTCFSFDSFLWPEYFSKILYAPYFSFERPDLILVLEALRPQIILLSQPDSYKETSCNHAFPLFPLLKVPMNFHQLELTCNQTQKVKKIILKKVEEEKLSFEWLEVLLLGTREINLEVLVGSDLCSDQILSKVLQSISRINNLLSSGSWNPSTSLKFTFWSSQSDLERIFKENELVWKNKIFMFIELREVGTSSFPLIEASSTLVPFAQSLLSEIEIKDKRKNMVVKESDEDSSFGVANKLLKEFGIPFLRISFPRNKTFETKKLEKFFDLVLIKSFGKNPNFFSSKLASNSWNKLSQLWFQKINSSTMKDLIKLNNELGSLLEGLERSIQSSESGSRIWSTSHFLSLQVQSQLLVMTQQIKSFHHCSYLFENCISILKCLENLTPSLKFHNFLDFSDSLSCSKTTLKTFISWNLLTSLRSLTKLLNFRL